MQTSDTVGALAAALAAAQLAITNPRRDAANPHLRRRYASLASVLDSVRRPLADAGLAVLQTFRVDGEHVIVATRLVHTSGEWVGDETRFPVVGNRGTSPAQAVGAAVTYCRRYALSALLGLADVDDDDGHEEPSKSAPKPKRAAPAKSRRWEQHEQRRFFAQLAETVTREETARLGGSANAYEAIAAGCEAMGKPRPSGMTEEQRAAFVGWLDTDAGRAWLAGLGQ